MNISITDDLVQKEDKNTFASKIEKEESEEEKREKLEKRASKLIEN